MTDRERLLKAILAHPDEDAPRLMYADEIEADEPERAEFIRVGCELARTEPFSPRAVELVRREMELWSRAGPDWRNVATGAAPGSGWWRWLGVPAECYWPIDVVNHEAFVRLDNGVNRLLVRRGFVSAVTCRAADWERHGGSILAAHPVRAVMFTDCGPAAEHHDDYRQYLSRRWPQVPPEGWTFAPPVFGEDLTHMGLIPFVDGGYSSFRPTAT